MIGLRIKFLLAFSLKAFAVVVLSPSMVLNNYAQDHVPKVASKVFEKAFPTNSLNIFTNCQSMVVYSLDSSKVLSVGQGFHQWRVVNTVSVKHTAIQNQIVTNVLAEIKNSERGIPPTCFKPRYGIRVTQGKKTLDLVICFECGHLYTFVDGAHGYAIFLGNKQLHSLLDHILTRSAR